MDWPSPKTIIASAFGIEFAGIRWNGYSTHRTIPLLTTGMLDRKNRRNAHPIQNRLLRQNPTPSKKSKMPVGRRNAAKIL
jgi:hypothetical protein